tara:strand:+ start:140 stop:1615 length:1476 start_codon:yes stop_codon:yes gene_type:complete
MNSITPSILLTGATGYVGGQLLKSLEECGLRVRCLARQPDFLQPKVACTTEVVQGDVLDSNSLDLALTGIDTAYYLVHSMGSSESFEEVDREGATLFGQAAQRAGVRRIIYLGGLGNEDKSLSKHLRSRQEVGRILKASGVPVLEFRASIVIGAGSLSFEMIRSLVDQLPVMTTPKWVSIKAQPIAIDDLIEYLMAALELPDSQYRVYEIGGADQVSYGEIMQTYAGISGKRIRMIPVPFLSPYISSLWLGLVTPLYARIGRKLIESIVHATVVTDDSALSVFGIHPRGINESITQALAKESQRGKRNRWSDAQSSSGLPLSWEGVKFKSRLTDSRSLYVDRPPEVAFKVIERIGGDTGWYAWDWLWQMRGFLDLLIGGVGMRRGRPDRELIQAGDTIDFWRVEQYDPQGFIRLKAEMKVPGRAWLEFEVAPEGDGSMIRQTALFDPVGWFGKCYWYSLIPVHQLVFAGMLKGIVREALSYRASDASSEPE